MKFVVLALVTVAVCAACTRKEEAVVVPAPESTPVEVMPAPAPVVAAPATPTTGDGSPSAPPSARVNLISAAGSAVKGDLTVANEGDAVYIRGEITGLAPGKEHGFQVHEVGECSLPDFKSAGGHFNPTKAPFGDQLGNLPNAKADENGRATINHLVKGPNLVDRDGAPTAIIGKSIVVNSMPNDYRTASAGSGARIACGVIR